MNRPKWSNYYKPC